MQQEIFDQSNKLTFLDDFDAELKKRRVAMYSVDAIKKAADVEKIYVLVPEAKSSLNALDRLFQLGGELDTPQGMCLVGPSGVGKTQLFKYFCESLPKSALYSDDMAAIGIRVPSKVKTGFLIQNLLNAIRYPLSSGSKKQLYMRRFILFEALIQAKTRLLWVDEAQHLMWTPRTGSAYDTENDALEFLRELIDNCRISLVLAGTNALDALPTSSAHLASRMPTRHEINTFNADNMWAGFVYAFVDACKNYDISFLKNEWAIIRCHMATDGNLRSFKRLIVEAILISFDSDLKEINQNTLKLAFERTFGDASLKQNPFI